MAKLLSYKDKIEYAASIYTSSITNAKLNEVDKLLASVISDKYSNEEEKTLATKLRLLINAKIYFVAYFDGRYLEESFSKLEKYLKEASEKAVSLNYSNVSVVLTNVTTVANQVHSVMHNAFNEIALVMDATGNPITKDIDLLNQVCLSFESKAKTIEALDISPTPFGPKVKIFDVKAQAIKDFLEVADWCKTVIKNEGKQGVLNFLKNYSKQLGDLNGDKTFTYYPLLINKATVSANAIVISTPFDDEAVLCVRGYERENSLNFIVINSLDLEGKTADFLDALFSELKVQSKSLLLLGLADYKGANKSDIIKAVLVASTNGIVTIAIDNKGDKEVYNSMCESATANQIPLTAVTHKFLTMPNYNDVISEMEIKGMITSSDKDFVRCHFAFIGFVGLNAGLNAFLQGKDFKQDLKRRSEYNHNIALSYLRSIPSQSNLVDFSWGDLNIETVYVDDTKKEFDYDDLKSSNPKNVRKILQSNLNIFAKIGAIINYCLLCGDDVSIWKSLTLQTKSTRINEATKLVSHLLQTQFTPVVEVVREEDWEDDSAGGLCCDGGKLIKYRESEIDKFDWLSQCIAHEVFHAFQHTVVDNGWRKWHWAELGITKNRIPEWLYNFNHYSGNTGSKMYKVEIVECDARAFEHDCFESAKSVWHTIDLE